MEAALQELKGLVVRHFTRIINGGEYFIAWFYEIRSSIDTVLKRDGGYPDREAATVAAREDAKKLKLSKHLGVPMVGKILVGQTGERAAGD